MRTQVRIYPSYAKLPNYKYENTLKHLIGGKKWLKKKQRKKTQMVE